MVQGLAVSVRRACTGFVVSFCAPTWSWSMNHDLLDGNLERKSEPAKAALIKSAYAGTGLGQEL